MTTSYALKLMFPKFHKKEAYGYSKCSHDPLYDCTSPPLNDLCFAAFVVASYCINKFRELAFREYMLILFDSLINMKHSMKNTLQMNMDELWSLLSYFELIEYCIQIGYKFIVSVNKYVGYLTQPELYFFVHTN